MKNKKKWNHCKAVLGLALIAGALFVTPTTVIPANAAVVEDNIVAPNSDAIQWHYKIENNKVYKRLYNHTACIWLTDWIYVKDLSE